MSALLCAILSVLAAAIIKIALRFSVVNGVSQVGLLILSEVGAFCLLICCLGIPSFETLTPVTAAFLLLNGLLWIIAGLYDIKSYQYLDASIGELFGMLSFILTTLAGTVLFHESITSTGTIGILLILISALYAGMPKNSASMQGSRYKIVAILFAASASVMNKYLCSFVDTNLIVLSGFLIPGLAYMAIGRKEIPALIDSVVRSGFKLLALPVFCSISYYLMIQAFAKGNLTTTIVIFQSCVAFVFIFEVVLLKVRQDLFKRSLASAACILGVMAVCVG